MICFQISIFEPLNTAAWSEYLLDQALWFAFKLVSLNHWIQLGHFRLIWNLVVICFQISIFEPLNTASPCLLYDKWQLWFAFKLVSLNHWIQLGHFRLIWNLVVICFQISIFEPLNTASPCLLYDKWQLWFAFKLVSLNHWIQPANRTAVRDKGCDLLSN